VKKLKLVGTAHVVVESFLFSVPESVLWFSAEDNFRGVLCSDYMIADEFPADIAAGSAYVAGHDEDGRPVLVMLYFFTSCMLLHFGIIVEPSAGIFFECSQT